MGRTMLLLVSSHLWFCTTMLECVAFIGCLFGCGLMEGEGGVGVGCASYLWWLFRLLGVGVSVRASVIVIALFNVISYVVIKAIIIFVQSFSIVVVVFIVVFIASSPFSNSWLDANANTTLLWSHYNQPFFTGFITYFLSFPLLLFVFYSPQ